jgi:hypothetical protein
LGGERDSRIDSSTSGFSGISLPIREAASLVTITLGRASSMRVARLAAANPPNTTEWMAPMRTVANMANRASGVIGM